MVEVIFSDSACGSLKMAQRYGEGEYQSGGIGVFFHCADGRQPTEKEIEDARQQAEREERLTWERAVPLGGNPTDVYGFGLMLSIGDVSEDKPGIRRQHELERLYSVYPDGEGRGAARELLQRAQKDLNTVCSRAAAGEAIRVWYSSQPDELCGLYWFMAQLERLKKCGPVYLVGLPEWEVDENSGFIQKAGCAELSPGEWHRYLPLQQSAPPVFMRNCASCWQKLQNENAPLRVVLNGRLISMPENLYDPVIIREIEAESGEFQEAMIIGRILAKYRLGIGDSWVALRIEEMIRAGRIETVTEAAENMPLYHRVLKRKSGLQK